MKKLFLLLLSVFFAGNHVQAQLLPAARKGVSALRNNSRAFVQQLNKEAPLVLGNYKIGFFSPELKPYAPYLQDRFFRDRLNYSLYPVQAQNNDRRVLKALHEFQGQSARFEANFSKITSQIQDDIFTEETPYARYLPKEVDVLYIGEIHDETRVQQEIVSLVRQLPSIYPNRTIYLAAEVVPTSLELTAEENLIFTLEELADRLDIAEPIKTIQVVTAALDVNILVYGLEDEMAVAVESTPKNEDGPTNEQFDEYAVSLEGMHFRNRLFARKIRELQVLDPGALIVVYSGMDHVTYHTPSSLPSMIKGKSFVVQVTMPSALGGANPLFASLNADENIRLKFNASPKARLVESWKAPTSYKRLLGNDLTIIVHEE